MFSAIASQRLGGEFRADRPPTATFPVFCHPVHGIVTGRPEKKVLRIHAELVVAMVQDHQFARERSVSEQPRNAVRGTVLERAVAVPPDSPFPTPAPMLHSFYFRPKAFRYGLRSGLVRAGSAAVAAPADH